jgi:mannonate dehydratase
MTTITDVRVCLTAPMGRNLLVAKVMTSDDGLYGLGCGTFTQRFAAVEAALRTHIIPLVIGRDCARVEELWRLMMFNGYWRGGPVLNNAISAIDIALWDIKAKQAGMPLYQLLGGKLREAAAIYEHADGRDLQQLEDHARRLVEERGLRHVRFRLGGDSNLTRASGEAGGLAYGGPSVGELHRPAGALAGAYYDPRAYTRATLKAAEHLRATLGDEIELLHDVHGRLSVADAVRFARDLEPYRLFFLEDPLPPEEVTAHARLRAATTTPIAASELFTIPAQWTPLIVERQIDFVRMHLSDIGGLTPARKVAALAEQFGVRTAWHGPGDCSPVGHAINLHLNLATPNFGVQELQPFTGPTEEVFPGCPQARAGYLYPNDRPGHGVDLDESLAVKFPCKASVIEWTQARLPDGTLSPP